MVVNKGVEVALTGNIGPNAFRVLTAAGIRVVTGVTGSVREAVEKYKTGEFKATTAPTVGGHLGMRRRQGRRFV
jgi:predicted Fe-Mo cluster-binding NifX family protein